MSFVTKNRAYIAAFIDRETTSQEKLRVGLCLQVKLSKPLDADTVSPPFYFSLNACTGIYG